ncbi:uncharacterized protein B0I36DRAFT_340874 [Microdochium trichocladiopsis]|uniref:Uncharacterized protein n=1 Tax=Microdochium trichocladiopsis TaxID=1682393 RepID=A0A9P8XR32_9PEZI|nr:uncharacterized protein B0I36DRAFT_340874 [Microdochium trichocladiopsis]KAH7012297.1 hypothetical protein B0I36DRAFT_340874 [Microdochium trichocladiopsis]
MSSSHTRDDSKHHKSKACYSARTARYRQNPSDSQNAASKEVTTSDSVAATTSLLHHLVVTEKHLSRLNFQGSTYTLSTVDHHTSPHEQGSATVNDSATTQASSLDDPLHYPYQAYNPDDDDSFLHDGTSSYGPFCTSFPCLDPTCYTHPTSTTTLQEYYITGTGAYFTDTHNDPDDVHDPQSNTFDPQIHIEAEDEQQYDAPARH